MYYLDNAATTQVLRGAADCALDCMTNNYGNPSSLHLMGLAAEEVLDKSRRELACVLKCKPCELYFTSSATESNNTAVFGAALRNEPKRKKIVTSRIEHPSVNTAVNELEKRGYDVVKVDPKNGGYRACDFVDAVDKDTALVSVMYVNNETGLVLPVEEIAKGVRAKNPDTLIHIDGVQAFCKYDISVKDLGADMFSVSAHKIHGPKGIGALYLKEGLKIPSLIYGGGQERNFRSGTESVPLIAAFGYAVNQMNKIRKEAFLHVLEINKYLKRELANIKGIEINSGDNASPYILNFSVAGIPSEVMLHYLEGCGIYLSSGSACSKGKKSGILPILGYSKEREESSLRVSFSYDTKKEAADALLTHLNRGIKDIIV